MSRSEDIAPDTTGRRFHPPAPKEEKKNQFIAESRCPLHCETSCRALRHPSCQLMLKRSSGPIGEGLRHKRFGVSTTFRIFTSHLSVSLVTQRQFFPLRAFNHIYCSDTTDVCVRPSLTIDEYCAASRAWLILEGNR